MTHIIDTILESLGPPARRYPVTKGDYGTLHYGPWRVYYEPPPIPGWQAHAWHYLHEDYDGAPFYSNGGPSDNRCGACGSFAEALNEIDEIEDGDDG